MIPFVILFLLIFSFIGFVPLEICYENNFKSHIQTLKLPDHKIEFVLLTDIAGFGDRAWYVYKRSLNSWFTKEMYLAHNTNGVLFWNYSEAGNHSENPKLEIVNDHYMVFSRGGAYHSLYDIDKEQVIENDTSPFHSYLQDWQNKNNSEDSPPIGHIETEMKAWVKKNLHEKIEKILKNEN